MNLIPAIDLHDGHCVQLQKGLLETATKYADDAGVLAQHWCDQGARRIHVVDLDGAFEGRSINVGSVERILHHAGEIPVQLGGGIRTAKDVEFWLERGISQVIIGTSAFERPNFLAKMSEMYPNRLILGLDARRDRVSTKGWQEDTALRVDDVIEQMTGLDLFAIIYTDIDQDGMLSGVNAAATQHILELSSHDLIASGGIQNMNDIEELRKLGLQYSNLIGAISGTALYEKRLKFGQGQRLLAS